MQQLLNSKKYIIEEETKHSNKFVSAIKESYYKLYKLFSNNKLMGCIKSTVIFLIPVFLLGFISAILLKLELFPSFEDDLVTIFNLTLGIFTYYFSIILTYKYMKDKITSFPVMLFVLFTNIACIYIMKSGRTDGFILSCGTKYLFLAIIFTFITVNVFSKFLNRKKEVYKIYTTEAQKTLVLIGKLVLPFFIIVIPTIIISMLVNYNENNELMANIAVPFKFIFDHCTVDIVNGVIYSLFVNVFEFFGVGLQTELTYVSEAGILNKNFFMLFVRIPLIFGFVLALLIFGKMKKDKIYGAAYTVPTAINSVNIVYYGFPMFLNPLTLIPCFIAPIITTIVSYLFVTGCNITINPDYNAGLTLIFYNSYSATDSGLGLLLQIICIAICFLSFLPFVLLNNYARNRALKENIKEIYPKYLEAKMHNKHVTIFDFDFELGETAKVLAIQLMKDMELMKSVREKVIEFNKTKDSYNKEKDFEIKKRELLDKLKKQLKIKSYFQPIVGASHVGFDENGKPVEFEVRGMECLMRWWYDGNYVIPPLAIELARTCGLEYEINSYLWENMLINVDRKKCKTYITFNISMNCLEKNCFVSDMEELFNRYDMDPEGFVIEITEEDEFKNEDTALKKIMELKEKGFVFAIDDYGAGQTSMKYFSTNAFELVKIDGDLVKKAKENEQVYDIIGNIKDLGKRSQKYANIQFKVLCEFIEDQESFERLKGLKVDYYQGFLFSKAMEFDDLVKDERFKLSKGSQKHV